MKRAYLILFAGTVALGLLLVGLGRMAPRRDAPSRAPAPPAPTVSLTIEVKDGGIVPETSSVPKDRRVLLRIVNRGTRPARVALSGYEDRLDDDAIAPGGSWSGEFVADRPGDDFAWLLDGEPCGKLSVTGSHLVEGHQ
jgi:hypothetical protein